MTNNDDILKKDIEESAGDIENHIMGIDRCLDRLRRFISLEAPECCINNEIRIIQYRALKIQSAYDAINMLRNEGVEIDIKNMEKPL